MQSARDLAGAVLLCVLLPAIAAPQALPNLTLLRVQYNTRKTTAQPQGELKAGVPDGSYQLNVELSDQSRSPGTATLAISLNNGLDVNVECRMPKYQMALAGTN
jgi:hypothetical protein